MIKLNIFAPFLADTYASSTFSLMEGHFKVAFAFEKRHAGWEDKG